MLISVSETDTVISIEGFCLFVFVLLLFLVVPEVCGSSWAREQTHATAAS